MSKTNPPLVAKVDHFLERAREYQLNRANANAQRILGKRTAQPSSLELRQAARQLADEGGLITELMPECAAIADGFGDHSLRGLLNGLAARSYPEL